MKLVLCCSIFLILVGFVIAKNEIETIENSISRPTRMLDSKLDMLSLLVKSKKLTKISNENIQPGKLPRRLFKYNANDTRPVEIIPIRNCYLDHPLGTTQRPTFVPTAEHISHIRIHTTEKPTRLNIKIGKFEFNVRRFHSVGSNLKNPVENHASDPINSLNYAPKLPITTKETNMNGPLYHALNIPQRNNELSSRFSKGESHRLKVNQRNQESSKPKKSGRFPRRLRKYGPTTTVKPDLYHFIGMCFPNNPRRTTQKPIFVPTAESITRRTASIVKIPKPYKSHFRRKRSSNQNILKSIVQYFVGDLSQLRKPGIVQSYTQEFTQFGEILRRPEFPFASPALDKLYIENKGQDFDSLLIDPIIEINLEDEDKSKLPSGSTYTTSFGINILDPFNLITNKSENFFFGLT